MSHVNWNELEIRLSVAEDYLSVRHGLQEFKTRFANGKSRDIDVNPIELVLAEILNNIAEHGDHASLPEKICFKWALHKNRFSAEISDAGVAYSPLEKIRAAKKHKETSFDNLPEGGFGWHIISALCSDIHYRSHGNINILKLQIPA
jgi:serine/threonine-protein kinase RsbW